MITLEYIRDERRACYSPERLAKLYDRPHTPLEVLTRKDGEWESVPPKDRLWTVLAKGVLPDRIMRLFACWCAEQAMSLVKSPDPRSLESIRVARLSADGLATDAELLAVWDAARGAARYAAWDVARAAAKAARRAAARGAAWDAARDPQLNQLVKMIKEAEAARLD